MPEATRKTAISWSEDGHIRYRGYRVDELMGRVSLGAGVWLILRGELPDEREAKLFETILLSVLDHGPTPFSVSTAVNAAATGAPLNAAVAAGVLAINKYHGGAIEDCMNALEQAVALQHAEGLDAREAAAKLAAGYKARQERISGFGHRLHASDPRTVRLFALTRELGLSDTYLTQAEAIEEVLAASGKRLPINADGAIAAVLCALRFPPAIANGIFMIARVPGIVAHVVEEQERNKPMRTVDVKNYEYDGPAARELE
jgi:citrate synthase